ILALVVSISGTVISADPLFGIFSARIISKSPPSTDKKISTSCAFIASLSVFATSQVISSKALNSTSTPDSLCEVTSKYPAFSLNQKQFDQLHLQIHFRCL